MTRRLLAVVATSAAGAAPAGLDPQVWREAMLEDVLDVVSTMRHVEPVLVVGPGDDGLARLAWPGTPVVHALSVVTAVEALLAVAALAQGEPGADLVEEVGVVCADAPDQPPLLLGKLHSALTSAQAAICPAAGGGLVAIAARVHPGGRIAPWLTASAATWDSPDAVATLRAAAPPRALHVGDGWHRVRTADDVARLDPGLEGWEATRALLGR